MHFHTATLSAINSQVGWFGADHKIRLDANFFDDVFPAKPIAVFFHHAANKINCQIFIKTKFFKILPAVTKAAGPPFWSTEPRPCTNPSLISPPSGSKSQLSVRPISTVSICPSMARIFFPLPIRPITLPRPSILTSSNPASSICRLSSSLNLLLLRAH
jgi:hypothetical protein